MNEFFGIKINAGRARSMTNIINATLGLLQDKAYERVSVTEICALAGVTRKTFYRHFDSKRSVVEAALDMMFLEISRKFEFGEAKPREVMLFGFEYLEQNRRLATVFSDVSMFDLLVEKIEEYVELVYDDTLHNSASFEPSLESYYKTFIAVGIISIARNWVNGGMKQSAPVMTKLTARLLSGVIA